MVRKGQRQRAAKIQLLALRSLSIKRALAIRRVGEVTGSQVALQLPSTSYQMLTVATSAHRLNGQVVGGVNLLLLRLAASIVAYGPALRGDGLQPRKLDAASSDMEKAASWGGSSHQAPVGPGTWSGILGGQYDPSRQGFG
eukprot:scaffold4473_cov421-Prasinococcus_capsulatus_cf.AAC.4